MKGGCCNAWNGLANLTNSFVIDFEPLDIDQFAQRGTIQREEFVRHDIVQRSPDPARLCDSVSPTVVRRYDAQTRVEIDDFGLVHATRLVIRTAQTPLLEPLLSSFHLPLFIRTSTSSCC